MNCPACSQLAGRVLDSRPYDGRQRRRYRCEQCKHQWETVEVALTEYEAVEEVRLFRAAHSLVGLLTPRLLAVHDELAKLTEAVAGKSLGAIRQSRSRKTGKPR